MNRFSGFCMALFVFLPSAASAEVLLGRWCDRSVPSMPSLYREVRIVVEDSGEVVELSSFADGGSVRRALTEEGGDVYRVVNSYSGDGMRVVQSTGDLQLFDNDGVISTAGRLNNEPQPGDCLQN